MKKSRFKLIVCFMLALSFLSPSYAIPLIYKWGEEKLIKVADFPDIDVLKTRENKYVDAGYRYKQISLFFIPIWNYEGEWCGHIGSQSQYVSISKTQLDSIAAIYDIKLPETPSLPFWEAFGGKLLFMSFLIAYLLYRKMSKPSEN